MEKNKMTDLFQDLEIVISAKKENVSISDISLSADNKTQPRCQQLP